MGIYNTILCLGDSLTYGSRDEYRRGYPAELSRLLNNYTHDQFWVVINAGINQDRSTDILRRTPDAISRYSDSYLTIILAGTNDTLELVPIEIYEDTMCQIIKTCQMYRPIPGGRKVILGSLISLEGVGLMSYSKDSAEMLDRYNAKLSVLSDSLKIPYVDLTSLSSYRVDKCHLNHAGYVKMAELFFKEVIKI